MTCPKCGGAMEAVKVDEVEVDRCTGCRGIWFDFGEDERLKKKAGEVDIGRAAEGGAKPAKVDCPRCKTGMIRMSVLNQPHIQYESCAVCFGVFFDAGEFKDAATETFGDFLKRIKAAADGRQ